MRFVIGSKYFFSSYPDFKPHDNDYLDYIATIEFPKKRIIRGMGNDIIQLRKKPKALLIRDALQETLPMTVGKFLVPEFANTINLTIDELKQFQPLIDKLDDKHKYEEIIYNAYIKNNKFELTQEQRDEAYQSYKTSRLNEPKRGGKTHGNKSKIRESC